MYAIKPPLSISSTSGLGRKNNKIAPLIPTNMLHVAMTAVLIAVNRLYFPVACVTDTPSNQASNNIH